ncbi:MAG: acyl-CoA dehydrogenase [Betaproteobacteria bacterium]|nr:acyl-CoA dehydrogenase [Betaproteobacteria bacterium]
MSNYIAPLRDIRFVLNQLVGLEQVSKFPGYEDATPETVDAILEEAAKFAQDKIAPLNIPGDQAGAKWANNAVTAAPGFKETYREFYENGWTALPCKPEFGGQGLPKLVSTAVNEMWKAANMAFALCPMLTQGAIESLVIAGSDKQKKAFLPKMISGEWTGTMNLTEPSAGSDLAAVRARAEPQPDGTFKIFGQKIFITWGDHDMTDNIVHLVLARTPTAPEGVKGISLFVVPKFMLNPDGSPGKRNDAYCIKIEHKLGIHASPTAVMSFGDNGGAIGELVGEENRGLEYMFVMMNAARFAVGLEGLGISERAYQRAVNYARERIQGPETGAKSKEKVAIIKHPDIRRMLMEMRAQTEAMRALAAVVAAQHDAAVKHPNEEERKRSQAFVDLMIPVVKGWCTENGIQVASTGIQVHGGMGFIEETGAAQHLRDSRIAAIYEGTTGIQANDLIGRKMAREGGATIKTVIAQMRQTEAELGKFKGGDFAVIQKRLKTGIDALSAAADWIVATYGPDVRSALCGAVPFMMMLGAVAGGWQMARSAMIAQSRIDAGDKDPFYPAKIATTRFYADHFLTRAPMFSEIVTAGAPGALALDEAAF